MQRISISGILSTVFCFIVAEAMDVSTATTVSDVEESLNESGDVWSTRTKSSGNTEFKYIHP